MTEEEILNIARVCHEAHRAWCAANGDREHKTWEEAEQYQRDTTTWGIRLLLEFPDITDDSHHDMVGLRDAQAEGWTYGPVRNSTAKSHPGMVPYPEMEPYQRKKKPLFRAIVMALLDK